MKFNQTLLSLFSLIALFAFGQQSFAQKSQEVAPDKAQEKVAQQAATLGGESLWGGLFWGGSQAYEDDPAAQKPLAGVMESLRKNKLTKQEHYALLGVDEVELPAEWFTWVRFSEEFFLRVERSGKGAKGELIVDVQFWQGEQLLSATNVSLLPNRPLIIRGPNWRGGYLIAVLAANPEKAE